jgi:ribonuclease HII
MKNFDNSFLTETIHFIAGVDEAGRGPLAGPVVAAAAVFSKDVYIENVNDCKKLKEAEREELYPRILEKAVSYGVGIVDNVMIDKINILQASLLAMKIAYEQLSCKCDLVIVDGNKTFQCCEPIQAIVKGDEKSFCIAAASIIAKVQRDRIMKELAKKYPGYLWEQNKGYPTKAHIEAVKKLGPTPLHRTTFLNNIFYTEDEFEF